MNLSLGPVKLSPSNARFQWVDDNGFLTKAAHAFLDGAFRRLGGYDDGVYLASFSGAVSQSQLQEVAQKADDAELVGLSALMEGMARRDARQEQEISELSGLVSQLQQQVGQLQQQLKLAEENRQRQAEEMAFQSLLQQLFTSTAYSTLGGLTTASVPEYVNLYYTDARARTALSALSPITYNSGTGEFGFDTATGWTGPTGTATRTGFDTSTATTANVAEALKALIDDLTTKEVIGA